MPVVTLLTDFGLDDTYVGVMKGVILGRAPEARMVDLTHGIAPQVVHQAAFLLEAAWPFFPVRSVHVVVVDPGVGTHRRRIAVEAEDHFFVGPDNGVLSGALPEGSRGMRRAREEYETKATPIPDGIHAVAIENEALFLLPVSATFEGRDVFAPVAAYLAAGGSLDELGPPVSEVVAFPAFRAPAAAGAIEGLVLHADRFGNLITDVLAADVPSGASFVIAGRRLGMAKTYGDAPGPAAIAGSSGHIEIAMPNGSAALVLGAGVGDRVLVTPARV